MIFTLAYIFSVFVGFMPLEITLPDILPYAASIAVAAYSRVIQVNANDKIREIEDLKK